MIAYSQTLESFSVDDATFLLASFAVKSLVILLTAAGVCWMLRKRSASARHLVWSSALIALLLLPAFSLLFPAWDVIPGWQSNAANSPLPVVEPVSEGLEGREIAMSTPENIKSDSVPLANGPSETWRQAGVASSSTQSPGENFAISPGLVVLAIWTVGFCLLLTSIVRGLMRLRRLETESERLADDRICHHVRSGAMLAGIKTPELFLGKPGAMPMVWGLLKGRLLLPMEAAGWPDARLQSIVDHELAHLKRRDPLTLLIGKVACAAFWFNPLSWLAARQMIVERERACDDFVLKNNSNAAGYASTIVELSTQWNQAQQIPSTAVAMASPLNLEQRVRAILEPDRNRSPVSVASVVIAVVLIVGFTGVVSAIAIQEQETFQEEAESEATGSSEAAGSSEATGSNEATGSSEVQEPGSGDSQQDDSAERGNRKRSDAEVVLDPEQRHAELITRAVHYIQNQQEDDGTWLPMANSPMFKTGTVALGALALIRAGEVADAEKRDLALAALEEIEVESTYGASLQIISLCESGDADFADRIKSSIQYLCEGQNTGGPCLGGWSYVSRVKEGPGDGSNSRFAVWALVTAVNNGYEVPQDNLSAAATYWLRSQREDNGGFSYGVSGNIAMPAMTSMTLSGIACLSMLKPLLADDDPQHAAIAAAIAKGWQNERIRQGVEDHENWPMYAWHIYAFASRITDREIDGVVADQFLTSDQLRSKLEEFQKPNGNLESPKMRPAVATIVRTSFAVIAASELDE